MLSLGQKQKNPLCAQPGPQEEPHPALPSAPLLGWLTPVLPTTSRHVGRGGRGPLWALLRAVSLLTLFAPVMSRKPL